MLTGWLPGVLYSGQCGATTVYPLGQLSGNWQIATCDLGANLARQRMYSVHASDSGCYQQALNRTPEALLALLATWVTVVVSLRETVHKMNFSMRTSVKPPRL